MNGSPGRWSSSSSALTFKASPTVGSVSSLVEELDVLLSEDEVSERCRDGDNLDEVEDIEEDEEEEEEEVVVAVAVGVVGAVSKGGGGGGGEEPLRWQGYLL